MFEAQQKYTGTQYATTAALLILAVIFSPAILIMSHPLGYMSISLALSCSALCAALAWFHWNAYSELTIPSIAAPYAGSR